MVRKIRAKLILELRAQGLSARAIAAGHGISRNSIAAVFEAVDLARINWDVIADLSEAEISHLVFPGRGEHHSVYAQPDWDTVHKDLARVGVTLKLLHSEYVDEHAVTGQLVMSYDRFCRIYQKYVLQAGVTSRVGHKAGQTVEVDWSGPTMQLVDPGHGQDHESLLIRGMFTVFTVCVRRAHRGYATKYVACRACCHVRVLWWLRAQDRSRQFENRGHPPPAGGRNRLEYGLSGDGRALLSSRATGPH